MYMQHYDETLLPTVSPRSGHTTGNNPILWPDEIAPYIKSNQVRSCPSGSSQSVAIYSSYGLNELNFADETDDGAPLPRVLPEFQPPPVEQSCLGK